MTFARVNLAPPSARIESIELMASFNEVKALITLNQYAGKKFQFWTSGPAKKSLGPGTGTYVEMSASDLREFGQNLIEFADQIDSDF